jgi:hypothetical protein
MAGGAETPNIAALPSIARLGACESARGPDADRRVKLLIEFAVEGSLSGAYSHSGREAGGPNIGCTRCGTCYEIEMISSISRLHPQRLFPPGFYARF